MNKFLIKMEENLTTLGSKTALIFSGDHSVMTYAQLDQVSGRVYAYLKANGIGKNDVVMVCLPRNLTMFSAMIGVWKAGAAYVLCEDTMAPERLKFTEKNSESVLKISMDNWAEIMKMPSLPGREKTQPHDLAYLVYTSGTTGTPKGVAHEYGNLEQSIAAKNVDGVRMFCPDDVLSLTSPFQTNANIEFPVQMWYEGGTLVLMDYTHTKNPAMLIDTYEEYGVTATFMTPSLYRSCSHMNSRMRLICLGGEPTVNLYSDTVQLYNCYNMSEAGRDIAIFRIDRPYGVTPIGKNQGGDEVHLLTEDGTEAGVGEQGEICFKNEFVRGFMGLPEKTAEAWRGGLFHTGDLGELLEGGNIVLKGRIDDMIKINGNRIEPAEIEVAGKELLGLKDPCAKGFVTDKQSFVVLYYTDDVELDPAEARAKLETRLNYYMIPSYFVHLDEYPLLPSGKRDKKRLAAPDISAYRKSYEAPQTEVEKKLCAVFEKVLGIDRIGLNDDFYELGGDSLSSMAAVVEYDDPALDAAKMFRFRTVKKIAVQVEAASVDDGADMAENDRKARSMPQLLSPFQTYLFDYQLYAAVSTMYNMPNCWRYPAGQVDAVRLAAALKKVMDTHPVFRTVLCYDEDINIVQCYDESIDTEVRVERVTENRMKFILPQLVQPFRLLNEPLYRIRLFESSQYVYLFVDIHHVICDGTSLKVFSDDLTAAYNGQELQPDLYYLIMSRQRGAAGEYREARKYFYDLYGKKDWANNVPPEIDAREDEFGYVTLPLGFDRAELRGHLAGSGTGDTAFFESVGLLTLAKFVRKDDVMVTWSYHGRDTRIRENSIGLMIRNLPLAVSLGQLQTVGELFAAVKDQMNGGIGHSVYPFSIEKASVAMNDTLDILDEGDLLEPEGLQGVGGEPVHPAQPGLAMGKLMLITVFNRRGVEMRLNYIATRYHEETMKAFCETYRHIAGELMQASPDTPLRDIML